MPLTDLQAAQELAQKKGLPYQTYMKMLLHQALEKERRSS
jgi:predicted DNA binding CopG/RHH family protein